MINLITTHHPYFFLTAVLLSFWVTNNNPSINKLKSWWDYVPMMKLLHQYLVNLSGCFLGWGALYYLLYARPAGAVTLTDLVITLIAYVGIMGYLPHLIINKGFKP